MAGTLDSSGCRESIRTGNRDCPGGNAADRQGVAGWAGVLNLPRPSPASPTTGAAGSRGHATLRGTATESPAASSRSLRGGRDQPHASRERVSPRCRLPARARRPHRAGIRIPRGGAGTGCGSSLGPSGLPPAGPQKDQGDGDEERGDDEGDLLGRGHAARFWGPAQTCLGSTPDA